MKVKDKLFTFFNEEYPFNTEGLEDFVASFEIKKYIKGEILLKENQTEKKLRFLNSGIVREFYVSETKEMNIGFYTKPEFISDFSSLTTNKRTRINQECLTDIEVRTMSKQKFDIFLEKYQCGKYIIESIFHKIIECKEKKEFLYFSYTPDELYQDLIKNKPEWLQLIPQYHIASYLRITPETLSRIRKRIS